MANTQDQNPRWVVRLRPTPDSDIDRLLQMPLGLDVWERKRDRGAGRRSNRRPDQRAGAPPTGERERLGTVEEYVSEFQSRPRDQHDAKDTNESDEEELQR